jgi:hypothetical protein
MVPSVAKPRDADAEADIVPEPAPLLGQGADGGAHVERHQHRLQRRLIHRDRIVEHHHDAVAGITFERAAVFDDDFADRGATAP